MGRRDETLIKLYVARHGETDLNAEKKLRGWIDTPLNRHGRKEAEQIAEHFKKMMLDKIYSSDLKRAEETADIIARDHGLNVIPRDWFRPLNYGKLNGEPLKEIQKDLEKLTEIWKTDPDKKAPGGESLNEFQNRNLEGLHKILGQAYVENLLLVAHLRNSLLFHEYALTGKPLEGDNVQIMDGKKWAPEPGAVAEYHWDNGKLEFVRLVEGKTEAAGKTAIS